MFGNRLSDRRFDLLKEALGSLHFEETTAQTVLDATADQLTPMKQGLTALQEDMKEIKTILANLSSSAISAGTTDVSTGAEEEKPTREPHLSSHLASYGKSSDRDISVSLLPCLPSQVDTFVAEDQMPSALLYHWVNSLRELWYQHPIRRLDYFVLTKEALYQLIIDRRLQTNGLDLFKGSYFCRRRNDGYYIYYHRSPNGVLKLTAAPAWWRNLPTAVKGTTQLCSNRKTREAMHEPQCLDKRAWQNGLRTWSDNMLHDINYCTICGRITCQTCMNKLVQRLSLHLASFGIDSSKQGSIHLNICTDCAYGPHFNGLDRVEDGFTVEDIGDLLFM